MARTADADVHGGARRRLRPGRGPVRSALGLLFVAGALMFSAAPAQAATTWYVAPGAGTTLPCTMSVPCNLNFAVASAASGDTIELEGGDYTASNDGQGTYPFLIQPGSPTTLTIEGVPGASVALDGAGAGPVLRVVGYPVPVNLTLKDLTIENGSAGQAAGVELEYAQATIDHVTFKNNHSAGLGGAVNNNGLSPVTIDNSTFLDNTAGSVGAAIENTGTPLTIENSTFSANTAGDAGAAIDSYNTMVVQNSTFVGNHASLYGAAINNNYWATVLHSTFSGNTSTGSGSDIESSGPLSLAASILTGGCSAQSGGAITDAGYNAVPAANGCTTGQTGDVVNATVSSDLGALAANGGLTETLKPAPGNAAIAAIPQPTAVNVNGTSTSLCPTTDQTGASSGGSPCTAGSAFVGVLTQTSVPTANVADGAGYAGQLAVSGATGAVSFTEATSSSAGAVIVSPSGAISASRSLTPGNYGVTGTASDTSGDWGRWAFTLTVMPSARLVLASKHGVVKGSDVAFDFTCGSAVQCQGSATVSVTRVIAHHGKKRQALIVIAQGAFAIPGGRSEIVGFNDTARGKRILARLKKLRGLRVTLVITLASGIRSVEHADLHRASRRA